MHAELHAIVDQVEAAVGSCSLMRERSPNGRSRSRLSLAPMASMVVPLDVAQMRLMLSMGFAQWIKDLQP